MLPIPVVTRPSQNHIKSLYQCLSTIDRSITRCYVYDLGLSEESSEDLKKIENIYFRTFDYSKYPSYYNININAGEYAWKPAIINEVTNELLLENGHIQYLLWCDSGNKLYDSKLNRVCNFLNKNLIYSPITSGNVRCWTHPLTLRWFSIDMGSQLLIQENRNGAILGFNITNPDVVNFIKEFARCASIKDCIAPEGSSRQNHRQDQAVFTILYYNFIAKHTDVAVEGIGLDITMHNDID